MNEVSSFLKSMLPRLQKGKVLDIAMGTGQNSVFLASHGFQVKGFDISDDAIEKAQALAKEKGVSVLANKADLDLFLFGLMEYDTIIMTFFKPTISRYYSEMIRALKQGGTLLIESYTIEDQDRPLLGADKIHDFYFRSNEVLQALKGMRILFYQEGFVDGHHRVQCLAQKPLDKDMAKFGAIFDATSSPKEDAKSAQQRLAESLFKKS